MESIILKALGNVNGLNASRFAERSSIENELVGTSSVLIDIKYRL